MATQTQTYNYTGSQVSHTVSVPGGGTTDVLITLVGGGGASGTHPSKQVNGGGGNGGDLELVLECSDGDVLDFEVGQGGQAQLSASGPGGAGGWPDGGDGGHPNFTNTGNGGGGGSTRLYLNSTLLAVAAGGGGGGVGHRGGDAGYPDGDNGGGFTVFAEGGTASAGGVAAGNNWSSGGESSDGDYLYGGHGYRSGNASTADDLSGGGGGGGYYGGAGGVSATNNAYIGGGAGSSWYDTSVSAIKRVRYTNKQNGAEPGLADFTSNLHGGDGEASFEYDDTGASTPISGTQTFNFDYAGSIARYEVALENAAMAVDVDFTITGGGGPASIFDTNPARTGGSGHTVSFTLPMVVDGSVIEIEVGEGGKHGENNGEGPKRTFPDGGDSQNPSLSGFTICGGSGGGSTRVYLDGVLVAVAGGGGAALGQGGGDAGHPSGADGNGPGGEGGDQSEGGDAPSSGGDQDGDFLRGGDGSADTDEVTAANQFAGGGGGGGYYGGGSGFGGSSRSYRGGGGGSSWTDSAKTTSVTYSSPGNGGAPGNANHFTAAGQGGHGSATITHDTSGQIAAPGDPGPAIAVTPPDGAASIDGLTRESYSGSIVSFTMSEDTLVTAKAYGGGGAPGYYNSTSFTPDVGGDGGLSEIEFIAKNGSVVEFEIGEGGKVNSDGTSGGRGGWPDGGDAGNTTVGGTGTGGGGGSTRVYLDGVLMGVGGAGGGMGFISNAGGDGGGTTGEDGEDGLATGGTQTEGGIAPERPTDPVPQGDYLEGGDGWPTGVGDRFTSTNNAGGGGGGGYYGGGGAASAGTNQLKGGGGGSGFASLDNISRSLSQGVANNGGEGATTYAGVTPAGDGWVDYKFEPIAGSGIGWHDETAPLQVDLVAPTAISGQPTEVEIDGGPDGLIAQIDVEPLTGPVWAVAEALPVIDVDGDIGGLGNISVNVQTAPVDYDIDIVTQVGAGDSDGHTNASGTTGWDIAISSPQFILASTIDIDTVQGPIDISPAEASGEAAITYDQGTPIGPVEITQAVDGSAASVAEFEVDTPFEIVVEPADGFSEMEGGYTLNTAIGPVAVTAPVPNAYEITPITTVPTPDITLSAPEADAGNTVGYVLTTILYVFPIPAFGGPAVGADFTTPDPDTGLRTFVVPPDIELQLSAQLVINFIASVDVTVAGVVAEIQEVGDASGDFGPDIGIEFYTQVGTSGSDFEVTGEVDFDAADDAVTVVTPPDANAVGGKNALIESLPIIEIEGDIGGIGSVEALVLVPAATYDIVLMAPAADGEGSTIVEIEDTIARVDIAAPQSIFAAAVSAQAPDPVEVTAPEPDAQLGVTATGGAFANDVIIDLQTTATATSTAEFEFTDGFEITVFDPVGQGEKAGSASAGAPPDITTSAPEADADGPEVFDVTSLPVVVIDQPVDGGAVGGGAYNAGPVDSGDAFFWHWRVVITDTNAAAAAATGEVALVDESLKTVLIEEPTAIVSLNAQVFNNFLPQITIDLPEVFTHEDVIDGLSPLPAVQVRAPEGYVLVDVEGWAPLRYKRSTTPGATPPPLQLREIAINEHDGVLFFNDGVAQISALVGRLATDGLAPTGGSEGNVLRADRSWGAATKRYTREVRTPPEPGTKGYLTDATLDQAAVTPALDTVYYRPFFLPKPVRLIDLGVPVDAGAAGAQAHVAVVEWDIETRSPGATRAEVNLTLDTAGDISAAVDERLEAGWYAAAFAVTGAAPTITAAQAPKRVKDDLTTVGDATASYAATLDPAPAPSADDTEAYAYVQGESL